MNKVEKLREDIISDDEFDELIPDENAAIAFLEAKRWNGQVTCPRCGTDNVYRVENEKPQSHRCRPCKRYFNVCTNTIFHGTQIPLRKWLKAIRYVHIHRKGVSSHQLANHLGCAQPSAWHVLGRIRKAMEDHSEEPWLEGVIQVDEAVFGGKRRWMHSWKKELMGDDYLANKMLVQCFRDGNGNVLALPVARPVTAEALRDNIQRYVRPGSTVYSDGEPAYLGLPALGYLHHFIDHNIGQYVDGEVTVNGVESFWALMKRGYVGTYHYIALYHLRRYVAEFTYRLNSGKGNGLRTIAGVLGNAVGRRLKWRVIMGREPADCLANA